MPRLSPDSKTAALVAGKVPAVTVGFWIIKILATTLGETGGDTVSMTMNLGYLLSTAIFVAVPSRTASSHFAIHASLVMIASQRGDAHRRPSTSEKLTQFEANFKL